MVEQQGLRNKSTALDIDTTFGVNQVDSPPLLLLLVASTLYESMNALEWREREREEEEKLSPPVRNESFNSRPPSNLSNYEMSMLRALRSSVQKRAVHNQVARIPA